MMICSCSKVVFIRKISFEQLYMIIEVQTIAIEMEHSFTEG